MAIEPPSQSLIQLLQSLNLATAKDLRACQTHLRHLVRDLPAFDSVWIDALVQGEKLTPFQAKRLTQAPESLKLCSYVLVDRLPHDGWPVRYQAQPLAGGRAVAIAVLPVEVSERSAVRERFQQHVESVQGVTHRNLCVATAVEGDSHSLFAISMLPIGESLDDLLVRRGRFPADVVEEIARQTLDGLSRLELAGTLHGDLRLRNLLLGPAGRILIINAGLLAAAHPQITIHGTLPIACHEGIAPELIGGRTTRTSASEMYALGCLLWQLLAGRRPYLTADRIEQLAAHQSGTIPDIRTLAPETPQSLAQLISRLVAKSPSDRFTSLAAATRECGLSHSRGRARLSQFQTSFQSMVPVRLGSVTRSKKPASLQSMRTAAVLIGAAALFLFSSAGRSMLASAGRLLQARQEAEAPASTRTSPSPTAATNNGSPAPLKTANAIRSPKTTDARLTLQETQKHSGQIVLEQAGLYAASTHSAVGELRISGAGGVRPVIEIVDQPLHLSGERVVLENLIIRRTQSGTPDVPLVLVNSQILIIRGCEFHSGPVRSETNPQTAADPSQVAIRWRHLDEKGILPGEIEVSECLFAGGAAVLSCDSVPQGIQMLDTACLGTGPVCEIRHLPGVRTLRMGLIRTTLRGTGPLLREQEITAQKQTPLVIDLRQSVFELSSDVALVEAIGSPLSRWRPNLKIDSNGSYLAGESEFVGMRAELGDEINPLDPAELDIEGLERAEVQFTGPLSLSWNNNVITRYTADVQSADQPGIRPRETSDPSLDSLRAVRTPTPQPVRSDNP